MFVTVGKAYLLVKETKLDIYAVNHEMNERKKAIVYDICYGARPSIVRKSTAAQD